MPSDQAPEATFHFFDLPRELRDKIYSEIGGDKISGRVIFAHAKSLKSDYPPDTECWNVSPLPRPALRLVSRQFSDEYEDMIAPLEKVLRVECGCTDIPDEEHPDSDVDNRLKLAAREVKTMELTIDTHTLAFTDQEIDWAMDFINKAYTKILTNLPHLSRVHLRVRTELIGGPDDLTHIDQFMTYDPPGCGNAVIASHNLIIDTHLCSILELYREGHDRFASQAGRISIHATHPPLPEPQEGFKLTTIDAASFDFDEEVPRIREDEVQRAILVEQYDREHGGDGDDSDDDSEDDG